MFKHILVAVDGSTSATAALDVAVSFAHDSGARLTICHVVDGGRASTMSFGEPLLTGACYEALEQEGREILQTSLDSARTVTRDVGAHLAHGAPVEQICAAAVDADLIVMGTNGRRGLNKLIIGSVAEGVIRGARVPVLVVSLRAAFAQPTAAATANSKVQGD